MGQLLFLTALFLPPDNCTSVKTYATFSSEFGQISLDVHTIQTVSNYVWVQLCRWAGDRAELIEPFDKAGRGVIIKKVPSGNKHTSVIVLLDWTAP